MPRQSNGWGECINCGEQLTPEDEEKWSDRCKFCLTMVKVWGVINPRVAYIEKQLKHCSTEEWIAENGTTGIDYWTEGLEIYNTIKEHLRVIRKLKGTIARTETYMHEKVFPNQKEETKS